MLKFEITMVVDHADLARVCEILPALTARHERFEVSLIDQPEDELPSETVASAITRRPKVKRKAPQRKRRSKVQEAIIAMLGNGPMSTAEIRTGLSAVNLSPASTSALTPMRAAGVIVAAEEGKWTLAA